MLKNKRQFIIAGIIGLIGAVLMFIGDMCFYYTTDFIPRGLSNNEIVSMIMKNTSLVRLIIGSILGPFAAFAYIIGFLQVYDAIKPKYKFYGKTILILLILGIIFGGAYHSHFSYIGITANYPELLTKVYEIIQIMGALTMIFILGGILVLDILILMKKTIYPRWFIFFTPLFLTFFMGLLNYLPQPFQTIIAGGWFSIIFIIFFGLSTWIYKKNENDSFNKKEK